MPVVLSQISHLGKTFSLHNIRHGINVKRLVTQMNVLEELLSSIALVLGASGTGKTVAVHAYLASLTQERRLSCAIVDVLPQITSKGLLSAILHQIGGNPHPHTSHDALLQTIDTLQKGKARLLILDQSDYLEREALEVLALLVEKTPCSLLLIGLPQMWKRLSMVPSIASRVGLLLQFGTLREEEVYEYFLPALVFPGWKFNPENEEDLSVGSYLWKHAQPSLRRVWMILACASQLVQLSGSRNITFKEIRAATSMTGFSLEKEENEGEAELPQSLKGLERKHSSKRRDVWGMLKSASGERQLMLNIERRDEL